MSETFKSINSQEELNAVIKERLERAEKSYQEKYADYDSLKTKNGELESKIAELTKSLTDTSSKVANFEKAIADKDLTIKSYESQSVKQRIAHEMGLPYEMAQRLNGEDEDAIKKDAQMLYKAINQSKGTAPLASSETSSDQKTEAYKSMLNNLFNK